MNTFSIHNNFITAKFSTLGAELISLKFNDTELMWNACEPWKRHAPVLFPIVGKLKNNTYYHQNQSYTLPQHGFARDMEWLCTYHDENCIEFELTDNHLTFQQYPFHFSLIAEYKIINTTLHAAFTIFNPDHQTLFFSIGWHPAFYLPFQLPNYHLKFYPHQNNLTCSVLKDGLISTNKKNINLINSSLPLDTSLFDHDALVIENSNIQSVELTSSLQNYSILIHGNAKNLGIWTKPDCKDFICIEPWMGIADYEHHNQFIQNKKDIIHLPPYQSFEWQTSIEITPKK